MRVMRTIKCEVCDTNYFENADAGCPKCSGGKVGVVRELSNNRPNKAVAGNTGGPSSGKFDVISIDRSVISSGNEESVVTHNQSCQHVNNPQSSPVCGWLVCVKGEAKGLYYRIIREKNLIGRDKSNHISLTLDKNVSMTECAILLYDELTFSFWIINGRGESLVRVNGSLLLDAIKLAKGDIIAVGDTSLSFVPLCGDRFSW